MNTTSQNRTDLHWLLILLALALLLTLFTRVAPAAAWEGDGRINLAGYLGGDSVYCVDASMNPVSNPVGAGLRLLNLRGEQMMYVSPEQIAAVSQHPAVNTIMAQGSGSYGPVYLSRLTNGNLQLTGTDDHGKSYVFEWTHCVQVTPIPDGHSTGTLSYSGQIAAACHQRFGGSALSQCLAVVHEITTICKIQELGVKECVDVFLN